MNPLGTSVYAFSIVLLFLKFFATISIQARERLRDRNFRHPEDARFWHGRLGPDSELTQRAQHLLRNDAESQLFYVGLGAIYLAIGAWPLGAPYYFCCYTASRLFHAYYFIVGRQPHRNRAFSVGVAVLFVLSAHVALESYQRLQ